MAKDDKTLDRFSAGDMQKGIDTFNPDFTPEFALTIDSHNVSTGINRGPGPRPGMSPLPNHSSLNTTGTGVIGGLRASEGTVGPYKDRKKFFALFPISMGSYSDLSVKGNMFLWIIAYFYEDGDEPAAYYLDAVASCSTSGSPAVYPYTFNVGDGLPKRLYEQVTGTGNYSYGFNSPVIKRLPRSVSSATTAAEFVRSYMKLTREINYLSAAPFAVSGAQYPQKWLVGKRIALGDANNTATANFLDLGFGSFPTTTNITSTGLPPSFNLRNFTKDNRDLYFYNYSTFGFFYDKYAYISQRVTDSTFLASFNQDDTTSSFAMTGAATTVYPRKDGTAANYAAVRIVLMNDEKNFCESSYRAVLVAALKPYAFVMQDFERTVEGNNVQVLPMGERWQSPRVISTLNQVSALNKYTENGTVKSTCWSAWPPFVDGTPLAYESALPDAAPIVQHVALGEPGTGVLRAGTIYEFTFSIFDKQFGTETNVGIPARIQTPVDLADPTLDYFRISLFRDGKYAPAVQFGQTSPFSDDLDGTSYPVIDFQSYFRALGQSLDQLAAITNYLEFRVYYRELGSYEWLPALFVDATQYYFYPDWEIMWACEAPIAALPGGQPGGFIDNSVLPDDDYDCVVNFKSRAFWFSNKQCVFSLRNNLFAYPLRNSAPAPTGGFRGAIIHTYRGQSEQDSRLVIFGAKETYIGRFTGLTTEMPIVISPDVTANYPVDGSDFKIETWTSITAFSFRSAVVADGDLYYWGQQGIYIDNGVGNPEKISSDIEPDLFELYDHERLNEINAVYDEKLTEIAWFYTPKADSTVTHALVFNVDTGQFFIDKYGCKVDAAIRLDTSNAGVAQQTNALRTVLSVRETSATVIQRGVFYDQINRSGDYVPKKELLVKQVAVGSSSNLRVLTLDTGYDATNYATIVTGDYLAIQQFKKYTALTTGDDMIAKITASTGGTITIKIPDGAVLPATTLTDSRKFFPVWHAAANGQGLNGIPWSIDGKYWMPSGVTYFGIWEWLYMMFKYVAWAKVDPNTFDLDYKTPSGGPFITDTIEFADNSDTNFQVYHAFRPGYLNNNGQALKLVFSGVHIGDEWVLQYMQLHGTKETGEPVRQYQG